MDKEIRQELREKGILPPIKPKLNRKKFAKEVREESLPIPIIPIRRSPRCNTIDGATRFARSIDERESNK